MVDEAALNVVVGDMVPDVLYDDRSWSRCKIVVIKCHMLQFGMLRGKMANSASCINMKAFDYQ